MNESDAEVLADRLELAFPGMATLVYLNTHAPDGTARYCVDLVGESGDVVATFRDLPFGNRVIGMTPEPAAGTER